MISISDNIFYRIVIL